MCLITKQKEPIILKKKLKVYKEVRSFGIGEDRIISSVYNCFNWTLGIEYNVDIVQCDKYHPNFTTGYDDIVSRKYFGKVSAPDDIRRNIMKRDGLISINKGFHSALNINRIKEYSMFIAECIISKGAQVYYDETRLCVSNKIKMLKIWRNI